MDAGDIRWDVFNLAGGAKINDISVNDHMNITELKKHVEDIGCKITKITPFTLVAECTDGITIIKEPESRMKILVKSDGIEKISSKIPVPKVKPRDVNIGKFEKQGPWSKIIKFGNLDEVEYVYGDDELAASKLPSITRSMERVERANKFAYFGAQGTVDPGAIVKNEVDAMASVLTRHVEDTIAKIPGNDVICGNKSIMQKSWTSAENEKYRFIIKVNCKVPPILAPVNEKLDNVGTWKTMSESDRFFIKSIVPPFKDVFVTGMKLISPFGKNQLELETVNENVVKKRDFLKNIASLKHDGMFKVKSDDLPVDVASLLDDQRAHEHSRDVHAIV